MVRLTLAAVNRSGDLVNCSQLSILNVLMQSSQLGLELNSPLGHAYIVPYKGQATFQLGYRGMIELARRSGEFKVVEARAVHGRDVFSIRYDPEPVLDHVPYLGEDDPGEITHVYAYARLKSGGLAFEMMTSNQVDRIRNGSVSANSPAWKNHWGEMAKKVVMKRLLKRQPCSIEMADAIDLDNEYDGQSAIAVDSQRQLTRGTAGLKQRLGLDSPEEPSFDASEGVGRPVYSEPDDADLPEAAAGEMEGRQTGEDG